jgi:hypothetical protein
MSIDMGTAVGGAFINMTASVKKLTLKQLDAIPDIQIRALSDSFTAMIKGSKNIKNGVRDWCAAFLPPDGSVVSVRFLKRLLLMIAVANVSTIKLARWGAGLRLTFLLFLGYQDVATDVLVGKAYQESGNDEAATISFAIIGLAVFLNVALNLMQNSNAAKISTRILGVLQAMFFLTPIVESYNHWTGKEQEPNETFAPVLVLVAGRAIELVAESVPESILQLGIVLNDPDAASFTMKFSIFASLAAAGGIMTETNISYELGQMNKQVRGRTSHPEYGLIPANKLKLALLHLGFFFFHVGYLAASLLAITSCRMAGMSIAYTGIYLLIESVVYHMHLWKTGRKHAMLGDAYWVSWMIWQCLGPTMQNFVPFMNSRKQAILGGKVFFRWILWRLSVNSVVFTAIMIGWEEGGVRASASAMVHLYCAAVGSAVVGIATIFTCVEDSHRWTLYSTRNTAKEILMEAFNGVFLTDAFQTRDGQALDHCTTIHLSYLEKDAVRTFLLSLSAKHALFVGDNVLPEEAGGASNWTYAHLFKRLTDKIKFYKDDALTAEIAAHFDSMTAAIAARNEARRAAKESAKALPAVTPEEDPSPAPLSELEAARAEIAELKAEVEMLRGGGGGGGAE